MSSFASENKFAVGTKAKEAIVIKNHPEDEELISFQNCLTVSNEIIVGTCDQIGAQEFYSKKELRKLRGSTYWKIVGTAAAGVLLFLITGGESLAGSILGATNVLRELHFVHKIKYFSALEKVKRTGLITGDNEKILKTVDLLNEVLN